ncbi:unnamed protein product [Linum trigynum]|uniref:Uncharacterized protein n=1 Tax=Linum trigynum TaxID=586398 RepID=A0AAV2FSP6_9ROSI
MTVLESLDQILSSIINERKLVLATEGEAKETKDFLQILLNLNNSGDDASSITDNQLKCILMDWYVFMLNCPATYVISDLKLLIVHIKHPITLDNSNCETD